MTNSFWVGTRKGLFRFEKSNSKWRLSSQHFLGIQVPMFLSYVDSKTGKTTLMAALKHGHFGSKVHRSQDNGSTWTELAPPVYPPKPEDVPDVIDTMRNKVVPWSLEMIWALERGQDGTLWCGTLPGGLFESTDDGTSWRLNMPLWMLPNRAKWFGGGYDLPGIHSICVDPRDANVITVALSCGGVWRSSDHGNTWSSRTRGMRAEYMPPELAFDPDAQDPHRMVQCPESPDTFWVQHHNGIFVSTDNCDSWQEMMNVKPSSFGFAVAVHPRDPKTAWFIPAKKDEDRYPVDGKFVVTRTTDGGATFTQLTSGLPQANAFHLVYRHCFEVSSSGDLLVFGTTTGSIWVSENGGDHWDCVTQDLPPIFVVRTEA